MSSVPTVPGEAPKIDNETKRVLAQRLATLEEDEQSARPWADVKADILVQLQRPTSR